MRMTIDISKSGRLEWIYAPDDASQTMPDITAADEDILYIYYDGRIRGEKAALLGLCEYGKWQVCRFLFSPCRM